MLTFLELVGLALIVTGIFVLAGTGWCLVAAGLAVVVEVNVRDLARKT